MLIWLRMQEYTLIHEREKILCFPKPSPDKRHRSPWDTLNTPLYIYTFTIQKTLFGEFGHFFFCCPFLLCFFLLKCVNSQFFKWRFQRFSPFSKNNSVLTVLNGTRKKVLIFLAFNINENIIFMSVSKVSVTYQWIGSLSGEFIAFN